jgi:Zn-dependent peptidase ImmA (M78 family)
MYQLRPVEELEQELYDRAVTVVEGRLPNGLKGLYHNDRIRSLIVLTSGLTEPERLSVLAEEAGHYHTSAGNILHLDDVLCRRMENRARAWAYERLVPPEGLITAWNDYVRTPWELAEYFSVTEEFVTAALEHYARKHFPEWHIDRYRVTFEPFHVAKHQPER